MTTLVDSNVWLALALSKHDFHYATNAWLASRRAGDTVLFCRATQISFLRLLTTRAVFVPYGINPLSNKAAWSTYEKFTADKRIGWVHEPPGLESNWKNLAANSKASPKLWMDAYLAAFALAGSHELVTTDAAFKQFTGLKLSVLAKT